MPYYAVYANGKTCIVETWLECKALTNRISNARYKKFTELDEAERYLDNIMNKVNLLESLGYEENASVVPSFINNGRINKGQASSEIFLTYKLEQTTKTITCPLTGKYILNLPKTYIATACSMSINEFDNTPNGFEIEEISTVALRSKGKLVSKVSLKEISIINNTTKQLIEELINAIKHLVKLGVENVHLTTDSNYILYILKENIFNDINIGITNHDIENKKEIKELYDSVSELNSLYCTKQTIGTSSMYLENIHNKLLKSLTELEEGDK